MSAINPYIIAEIASSHEGDPKLARRLIELAAGTGTDAIKLQRFKRDVLLSKYHPKYDSFGEIELKSDDWFNILKFTSGFSSDIIIEVYDSASLELAESSGVVSSYKIPTSDISNGEMLKAVCACNKPVYIGIGGATFEEISAAVKFLRKENISNAVLLHGFQSYPTQIENSNLDRIRMLKEKFGFPVGYADHTDADNYEMAVLLPAMAMSLGASVIEKHFTDDRDRKGRDYYSAFNPDEFSEFVKLMKNAEDAMGKSEISLSKEEIKYRHAMKRQAIAGKRLDVGECISEEDIVYKRTGQEGLTQEDILNLTGRSLTKSKNKDEPLMKEDFK